MTQDEIRAIALEVARELLDEPLNIGQAEHYTDFATRFLAAERIERLARQVPEGYVVVQRKVTEDAKCVLATPGNYRTYQDQWAALIAAGEVKP